MSALTDLAVAAVVAIAGIRHLAPKDKRKK